MSRARRQLLAESGRSLILKASPEGRVSKRHIECWESPASCRP